MAKKRPRVRAAKHGSRVRKAKRTVTIGNRTFQTKRANVAVLAATTFVTATTTQLRVAAEETRELLLDRLYAAKPQSPAEAIIARPRALRDDPGGAFPDVVPLMPQRGPLRHKYLRRHWVRTKAKRARDGRKLIETGLLTHSLEVYQGKQAGLTYYMVRPIEGQHETFHENEDGSLVSRGSISFRKLWMVHEFGSRRARVPARPTWGPVSEQIAEAINGSRYRQRLKAAGLRASLRRLA